MSKQTVVLLLMLVVGLTSCSNTDKGLDSINYTQSNQTVEVEQEELDVSNITDNSEKKYANVGVDSANEPIDKSTLHKDVIGLLEFEDIGIKEYVYYDGTDFYLKHNAKGNYSVAGEIYLDERCDLTSYTTYYVINGHNMMDGSKFGDLDKVYDLDFSKDIFFYYTDFRTNKKLTYRVFSLANVDSKEFFPMFDFEDNFSRLSYINKLYSLSSEDLRKPSVGVSVMTLNTCSSPLGKEHLLVSGELTSMTNLE